MHMSREQAAVAQRAGLMSKSARKPAGLRAMRDSPDGQPHPGMPQHQLLDSLP